MSDRRQAILEFKNGGWAILTASGWRVDPRDDVLCELLNREYSLIETQRVRETRYPDLLGTTARRAAIALGAEILECSPPVPALAV